MSGRLRRIDLNLISLWRYFARVKFGLSGVDFCVPYGVFGVILAQGESGISSIYINGGVGVVVGISRCGLSINPCCVDWWQFTHKSY